MIGGPTGDGHKLRYVACLFVSQGYLLQIDFPLSQIHSSSDGIGERVGLLEDLFLHEVLVAALCSGHWIPGNGVQRWLEGLAIKH